METFLKKDKLCLRPLPGYAFDPCKRATGRVDRFSTVRYYTNNYSVPVAYYGCEVAMKVGPEWLTIYSEGQCIAQHRTCLEKKQNIYVFEHYLPLLEKKDVPFFMQSLSSKICQIFLHWLEQQNLQPKELTYSVSLPERRF